MPTPELFLVAAVAANGVIGRDNDLVFRHPDDARHFRTLTMGLPVIMGRRTWESLPARMRPLPGRANIVVTRQADFDTPGAERAGTLDEALALAQAQGAARAAVIGGQALYADAMPLAHELHLTEVHAELDGDVCFPPWPREDFVEVSREARHGGEGPAFDFVVYRRRPR